MTDDETVEVDGRTWTASSHGDVDVYSHDDGRRTTDVNVRPRVFDPPLVDVAGPNEEAATALLDAVGVDEDAEVRRWDRVEAGRGTWFESREGDRKMYRHEKGPGDPTVGVATLDADGAIEELTATGPDVEAVLEAFDEARVDRWRVTGVEMPDERVAAHAGRAARVEWSTDHPGVDAAMTFDGSGRATDLLLDGPDPAVVDPAAASRANIGPIDHVDEVDPDVAARIAPATVGVEWADGEPTTRARSQAYLRTDRRGVAALLRSVDDVHRLLDDETVASAPELAGVVEELREENVEALASSDRFAAALSDEARAAAAETVTTDVVAAGPGLDGLLDEIGPDRVDAYLAWHASPDPAERAALAADAPADVVAWPEDVAAERTVRTDDGDRRRVTRCATADDDQTYLVHVDEFGRSTYGYVDHAPDDPVGQVSGPNPDAVATALSVEPGHVVEGTAASDLTDRVDARPDASVRLTDRLAGRAGDGSGRASATRDGR